MILEAHRDDLVALQGGTARFYAAWLANGVTGLMVDDLGPAAFAGAESHFGGTGAVEDDLALIYDALNRHEQSEFRLGIRLALAELKPETPAWFKVASPLLHLATIVDAKEVLDVIPSLVVASRGIEAEDAQELCELAVDAAIELAAPSPGVVDHLRLIVSSPGFSPAAAGEALLAFARAAPADFAQHLDTLREALTEQYWPGGLGDPGRAAVEDRDALLVELAHTVPKFALAREIGRAHV